MGLTRAAIAAAIIALIIATAVMWGRDYQATQNAERAAIEYNQTINKIDRATDGGGGLDGALDRLRRTLAEP